MMNYHDAAPDIVFLRHRSSGWYGKSMLYNNGYPLYVYNDASDVDLRRRGTKKNPGAMKLVIKKVPAPDSDGRCGIVCGVV